MRCKCPVYLANFTFRGEQQEFINIFEEQLSFVHGNEPETPVTRVLIQGKADSR